VENTGGVGGGVAAPTRQWRLCPVTGNDGEDFDSDDGRSTASPWYLRGEKQERSEVRLSHAKTKTEEGATFAHR
jgi:hypothetical protein